MNTPERAAEVTPGWEGTRTQAVLNSVQRLTGIGIWSYDIASSAAWWSDLTKRLHGFEDDDTPSMDQVINQYVESDRETVRERIATAVETGDPFEIQVELAEGQRRNRLFQVGCEPQTVDGDTVALYGTVREVTEAKRREQRIEVLRRTSQRLKRANTEQAVVEIMADASKNILGLVNTTIRLVDDNGDMLRTIAATEECVELAGERPDYPVDDANPASRVYRTGEPEIYADIRNSDDDWDRGELVSGMYVPIGTYGVLSTGFVVADTFDERDLEATGLLCQVGADALTRISWVKRSRAV